ncbi:hypothetical protein [Metallibacterium sp.]|uniref:hypothetical protein n=1 Tax=Metallibacterium sp. TaxID=2940281 RepID=UPI0026221235|nr:hypothetical protein [Metallibacterium sp.]
MSRAKTENAVEVLARMRAAHLESVRRGRARAAVVIGGLTLDEAHVRALKVVQKALRVPTRAAAIRAAIMLAAEVAAVKK